jgi:hypothetical protein
MGLVSPVLPGWNARYCSGLVVPLPLPAYAALLALSVRT